MSFTLLAVGNEGAAVPSVAGKYRIPARYSNLISPVKPHIAFVISARSCHKRSSSFLAGPVIRKAQ
jgi:hypothetical protein